MASFLSSGWPVRKSTEERLDGLVSPRLVGTPGELECPRGGEATGEWVTYMYTMRK